MDIADLISPERIVLDLRVRSKAQLVKQLGRLSASFLGIESDAISNALQAREELGSTGMGRGFALPHARVAEISGLFGMFVRLSLPIEFQAIDDAPVDLLFLLLIPTDAGSEHVAALAAISRRFRDQSTVQQLRKVDSAEAAYRLLRGA